MSFVSVCSGDRGRQRQEDFYESEARQHSAFYIVHFKPLGLHTETFFQKQTQVYLPSLIFRKLIDRGQETGWHHCRVQSWPSALVVSMACRARDAFLGILCKVFPFRVFPCVWGEGDQSAMLGCVAAWPALFKQRGPAWTRVDNGEGQT